MKQPEFSGNTPDHSNIEIASFLLCVVRANTYKKERDQIDYLFVFVFNPTNAKATFVQRTRSQIFLKTI